MSAMKEESRASADQETRFRVINQGVRQRNKRRRPVAGQVDAKAAVGELMEAARGDFTDSQKRLYGILCREQRAAYGLTDGLRLDRGDFRSYLERRRAADAQARGWA
jgi:hypothetical protein